MIKELIRFDIATICYMEHLVKFKIDMMVLICPYHRLEIYIRYKYKDRSTLIVEENFTEIYIYICHTLIIFKVNYVKMISEHGYNIFLRV